MYIKFVIVGFNILLDGGPQRCTRTSREVGILLHQTALQRGKTREGCEGIKRTICMNVSVARPTLVCTLCIRADRTKLPNS